MADANNLVIKDKVEEEAMAKSCEQFLACLFILMVEKVRYKPLKDLLNNEFLMGKRSYPETVIEAKQLLAVTNGGRRRIEGSTDTHLHTH